MLEAPGDTSRVATGSAQPLLPGKKPVVVVDYDPAWPAAFARLRDRLAGVRDRLAGVLGDLATAIEHVGSTSVPGLAAKPVVDIDVVVPAAADVPEAIRRLAVLGYRHQGDLGIPGREAFRGPPGDTLPPHHLYVCPAAGDELRRHLAFRNYLRTHPGAAARYAMVKREGARLYPADRDAYQEHKAAVVRELLERALAAAAGAGPTRPGPALR
jgi:GrpB-like predicted nucleotidyltransferase (UPF0157 family)